jgi:hypothetical protein
VSGAEPGNVGEDDRKPSLPAVREQLERILARAEFVAADRLRSFLSFAVTETLAGRAARLKAYTIAPLRSVAGERPATRRRIRSSGYRPAGFAALLKAEDYAAGQFGEN